MSTGVVLWRSVQSSAHEREDVRAQVGNPSPRQDEEPRVVDDRGLVLVPQLRCPSDEAIARRELACLRAEAEHGERPVVAVMDGVSHPDRDRLPPVRHPRRDAVEGSKASLLLYRRPLPK